MGEKIGSKQQWWKKKWWIDDEFFWLFFGGVLHFKYRKNIENDPPKNPKKCAFAFFTFPNHVISQQKHVILYQFTPPKSEKKALKNDHTPQLKRIQTPWCPMAVPVPLPQPPGPDPRTAIHSAGIYGPKKGEK
jgi:hypothetical protein